MPEFIGEHKIKLESIRYDVDSDISIFCEKSGENET